MPVLKSLSFTALPKNTNDPVHIRRAKFISKLEEQKQLLEDPGFVRTVHRTAEIDGQKAGRRPQAEGQALVEDRPFRPDRDVDQVRRQADRVREGGGWGCGAVQGEAPDGHQYPDRSRSGRRTGRPLRTSQQARAGFQKEDGLTLARAGWAWAYPVSGPLERLLRF